MIKQALAAALADSEIVRLLLVGALGLFAAVFFGAVAWVYRRGSAEAYSVMEKMPLEERP